MTITDALIIASVAVVAALAIMGTALSVVQWGRELRAVQLLDKQTSSTEKR